MVQRIVSIVSVCQKKILKKLRNFQIFLETDSIFLSTKECGGKFLREIQRVALYS